VLIVASDTVITAEANSVAVQAGLGAGAANGSVAISTVDPSVKAFIGNDADILLAYDALVQSRIEADVNAEALGVSVDLATGALGASVAFASLLPEVSAYIGGSANLVAGNNVTLRSASNYDRDGRKLKKGARATATSGSGGLIIGGSGAFATVENSPNVETYIDTDSVVTAGNDVLLVASANNLVPARLIDNPLNPSQKIEIGGAHASGAGFGALGIGVSVSEATIGGSVLSHINGASVNAGHDVSIAAESIAEASAKAWAVSGGIAGGTGNEVTISVKPEIKAYVGSGASIVAGKRCRHCFDLRRRRCCSSSGRERWRTGDWCVAGRRPG
jgi:hypothetical protein